jgi:hypothetical protein
MRDPVLYHSSGNVFQNPAFCTKKELKLIISLVKTPSF